jgi:hypothetical protein
MRVPQRKAYPFSAGNDDEAGRLGLHHKLRSILMSPHSFALFRGFNSHKCALTSTATILNKADDALENVETKAEIMGLRDSPDFFDFQHDKLEVEFEFSSFLSRYFDPEVDEDESKTEKVDTEKTETEGTAILCSNHDDDSL